MKKGKKKQNKSQSSKNSQQESQEIPESQDTILDMVEEPIDTKNFMINYSIQLDKGENAPQEQIIGVQLTETSQPFFYIHNDAILDCQESENETQITDVFGHKCDIGQVSFTNLEANGKKITLPTDLISSFCDHSLASYFGKQNI